MSHPLKSRHTSVSRLQTKHAPTEPHSRECCTQQNVILWNLIWQDGQIRTFPLSSHCANGGAYARHCKTLFAKQVFPTLQSPLPIRLIFIHFVSWEQRTHISTNKKANKCQKSDRIIEPLTIDISLLIFLSTWPHLYSLPVTSESLHTSLAPKCSGTTPALNAVVGREDGTKSILTEGAVSPEFTHSLPQYNIHTLELMRVPHWPWLQHGTCPFCGSLKACHSQFVVLGHAPFWPIKHLQTKIKWFYWINQRNHEGPVKAPKHPFPDNTLLQRDHIAEFDDVRNLLFLH